nr:hypothetical protein [Tanacetum cinerariifolium]
MLNPTPYAGMELIFETTSQMDAQTPTLIAPLPMSAPTITPSTIATITTTQQFDHLRDEAQVDNDEFLKTIDENMQKIIKEQLKEQLKAIVDAYESDKFILDTYGDTVTLKRRRNDDADKDEKPSVGPDRGSKRRREGNEPEAASAPTKTATRSAGKSTQGSKSR